MFDGIYSLFPCTRGDFANRGDILTSYFYCEDEKCDFSCESLDHSLVRWRELL